MIEDKENKMQKSTKFAMHESFESSIYEAEVEEWRFRYRKKDHFALLVMKGCKSIFKSFAFG